MSPQMTPDVQPAESSPAPQQTSSDVLAALSPAARESWRLTGELPSSTPPSSDDTSASSPDAPARQAGSTDPQVPPASETGTTSKPKTEDRFQTILRERREAREENERLRQRLAEVERKALETPASEKPAAAKPLSMDEVLRAPDVSRPALTEAEFFEQFPDAPYGAYARYAARYEIASSRQEDSRTQQQEQRQRTIAERHEAATRRWQKAVEADPALSEVLEGPIGMLPTVDSLEPGQRPTAAHILGQELLMSEAAPQIASYLSEHPDEVQRILALPSFDGIIRAIGRLEARLTHSETASNTRQPVRTVTKAPAPPVTLGRKVEVPADEESSALSDGDFRRYRDAANARELAGRT